MSATPLQGPFHFIGIGGAGMSPLAEILRARGEAVSGSDAKATDVTARLAAMGVPVAKGHAAANLGSARSVIYSSAIGVSNPEFSAARERGSTLVHRGDLLTAVMAPFTHRVAISGSHGKTTTTAMTIGVLEAAGFDPTALVGGTLRHLRSGARIGQGDAFVAEADESDRSFLKLRPTIAVVTNVDREHLDTYSDLADVRNAFAAFVASVPAYGKAILCADDAVARDIAVTIRDRAVTYGLSEGSDVRGHVVLEDEGFPSVHGVAQGEAFRFRLGVFGEMNALNALAAIAVGRALGIPAPLAARALEAFRGVGRRLEWKGRERDVDVWDDYGHHPTEIAATLRALRARTAGRRLVALFQPHRVTRTRALWEEFVGAFGLCDELWLADIYPAGEALEPGIDSERLARAITAGGRAAHFAGSLTEARARVFKALRKDDVFLTLGAGNVVEVGEAFLADSRSAS